MLICFVVLRWKSIEHWWCQQNFPSKLLPDRCFPSFSITLVVIVYSPLRVLLHLRRYKKPLKPPKKTLGGVLHHFGPGVFVGLRKFTDSTSAVSCFRVNSYGSEGFLKPHKDAPFVPHMHKRSLCSLAGEERWRICLESLKQSHFKKMKDLTVKIRTKNSQRGFSDVPANAEKINAIWDGSITLAMCPSYFVCSPCAGLWHQHGIEKLEQKASCQSQCNLAGPGIWLQYSRYVISCWGSSSQSCQSLTPP